MDSYVKVKVNIKDIHDRVWEENIEFFVPINDHTVVYELHTFLNNGNWNDSELKISVSFVPVTAEEYFVYECNLLFGNIPVRAPIIESSEQLCERGIFRRIETAYKKSADLLSSRRTDDTLGV